MGRSPSCDENGLKRGPWTPEEDEKLVAYIKQHGHGSWRALPKLAGLNRCGKSCRLRWTNYLRPDIKRGKFSEEEEQTILNLHSILGNKWSAIASQLPGRTDNEIKNFWNTHLKKKLIQMGFDPITHMPRTDNILSNINLLALANLQKLLVLELQPLEKLQFLQHHLQPLQYDHNMTVPFAHLPNLQFYNDQTMEVHPPDTAAVYGQTDNSMWLPSSSSNAPPLPLPPPTSSTISTFESESAPLAWLDLLAFEDPLFDQIDDL